MTLQTLITNELIENQGRDKTAAKTNGKRIVDLVDAYLKSCIPKEDGWVGPTSDFKSNVFGGLYE